MQKKEIKYLIIIPCRKNSSRVKNKNIRKINGKSLFEMAIEQGLKIAKSSNKLIVNTDHEIIINYCKKNDINFFKRPRKHALNNSNVSSTIIDMIQKYESKNNYIVKNIILLQVTSPLRKISDIKEAINKFENKDYKSLCSVCETSVSPFWTNSLSKNLKLDNFLNKKYLRHMSQNLPKRYQVNGAIFISEKISYLKYKRFFNRPKSVAHIMPIENSIDIDNEFDYIIAKKLLEKNEIKKNNYR